MEAVTTRTFNPKWPKPHSLDFKQVVTLYDHLSDTLIVHFYGLGRPAVSVPMENQPTDQAFLLVDARTEEVVGIQIEEFLSEVVHQEPRFLQLAELAGVDRTELDAIRNGISQEDRKRAAVAPVFDLLAPVAR
jgi:hypothetical protein